MPIVEAENSGDSGSIINTEKIEQVFSFYKFPLILAAIGIVFLLAGLIYIIKTQDASSEVIFSSESSTSAMLSRAKIRIDIQGAVIEPGVYEMTEGERISDALVIAGGLSANADRDWIAKNLNRAAKLTDGGKIYIPTRGEMSGDKPSSDLSSPGNPSNLLGVITGKVNVNTASQTEIEGLPGVGPVTAGKIISGRPYQAIEELKSRKIVGNALFEKIKDLLVVY